MKEDEPLSNARRARWLREQCRALPPSGGPLSSSGTAQLDPMTRRLTFTSAEGEQAVWQGTVFDEPKVLRLWALDRWDFVPVECGGPALVRGCLTHHESWATVLVATRSGARRFARACRGS